MKLNLMFNYKIKVKFSIIFNKKLNVLILKNRIGVIFLYLPRFFLYKFEKDKLIFCFANKYYFSTLVKQFFFFYKFFYKFYFFRLRLKGLGYRIKRMTKNVYRFFMAYNHYFYFYVPVNIYIWQKKRNILALSINKNKLNDLFNQLILLKKLDYYERTNSFIVPKKIIFLKK